MAYDFEIESAVRTRYGAASQEKEEALCCPVEYDPQYLRILPAEIIERDYGCGDPSAFVKTGETVLDLGSGGGKICYIASQIVGEAGKVIGVDTNTEMLALAEKYRDELAQKIGYGNTEFRYGKIQDLKVKSESWLMSIWKKIRSKRLTIFLLMKRSSRNRKRKNL